MHYKKIQSKLKALHFSQPNFLSDSKAFIKTSLIFIDCIIIWFKFGP